MKLTQLLYKQHIGRSIRKLWYTKRERKIGNTGAEKVLSNMGIQVRDASEIIQSKKQFTRVIVEPSFIPKIIFNETHPDWKDRACLTFKDHNVLQEGLHQAQILTNTICLPDNFSNDVEDVPLHLPENIDDLVKRIIYTSNIFDACQEKLPKKKDPNRPAWVFPRDYGITNARKMCNMSRKFLQLCELLSGPDIVQKRHILYNGITKLNLDKESDFIQFTLRSDVMVLSVNSLKPIENSINNIKINMPSIYPLHHTIGLETTNFYKTEDIYPVSATSPWINVHTIFVHYDPVEVKNLTELAVTESQIFGRAMMKSYTVAVSCARQRFESSVNKLPEPITVQCIHSDGQNYNFFIFQLNSLDVNNVSEKNFWCTLPSLKLFEKAQYDNGRPIIESYNPEVFKRILAFYRNGNSNIL